VEGEGYSLGGSGWFIGSRLPAPAAAGGVSLSMQATPVSIFQKKLLPKLLIKKEIFHRVT